MNEVYNKLLSLSNSPEPEAQLLYNELLMELTPRQRRYFTSIVMKKSSLKSSLKTDTRAYQRHTRAKKDTRAYQREYQRAYQAQYRKEHKSELSKSNSRLAEIYKQEKIKYKVEPTAYSIDLFICNMDSTTLSMLSEAKKFIETESSLKELQNTINLIDIYDDIYKTVKSLLIEYSCIVDIFRSGDSTLDSESFEYIRECYQKNKELRASIQHTITLIKNKLFNRYKTSVALIGKYNPYEIIRPLILLYSLKSALQAAKTLTYREGYLYTKLHRHSQWARGIKKERIQQERDRLESFEKLDKLLTTKDISSDDYWASLGHELTENEGCINGIEALKEVEEIRIGRTLLRKKHTIQNSILKQ